MSLNLEGMCACHLKDTPGAGPPCGIEAVSPDHSGCRMCGHEVICHEMCAKLGDEEPEEEQPK